jgi:hypothetical protein
MTYKEIYKELHRKIRRDYGSRCIQFCIGCVNCQSWLMLSILQDIVRTNATSKKK